MTNALDVTTAPDAAAWDDYVSSAPGASIYHRYAWRSFYEDFLGKETHYLQAEGERGVVGVLPLVRMRHPFFGDYLASLPMVNYGGVVGESQAVAEKLVSHAKGLVESLGSSHVELRHAAEVFGLPSRTDKVAVHLALPDDPEALMKSFRPKLRSQIRRPLREEPEVRRGALDLLDDFYAVFSRNMRDLGTPVYGRSFFEAIIRLDGIDSEIVSVRIDGEPAAAAFLIHGRDNTEIPWASTNRAFNKISVNMLLYWEALSAAIENGSAAFDFGRSTRDSGPHRFKRQWGGEDIPLHWEYLLPDGGEVPHISPDNSKYSTAVRVWQRLPLAVSRTIGPLIARHLP